MSQTSKNNYWLLFFIILKFIAQYLVQGNPVYELQRDEYLHLDQARHLAWGYHSVPPFTSWLSWIIMQLGNSVFWIRFFPSLFGALTIVLIWKTVEVLNGKLYAMILVATALIFSVLLRVNLLYQPNSPDVFFWTLLFFAMVKYVKTEQYKWLYLAAIAFAFGFLNKYNIVFCVIGLLPALLLTSQSVIFLKKQLYLALLLTILIILPNLLWQYNNHFPVIAHMKELRATQLENISRLDFVKEQFLMFINVIILIVAGFISFFTFQPAKKYRFLFFAYVITIGVFIFFKGKAYYAIGLYPIFIVFGSVYLEHLLQYGWKRYLRIVLILVIFILFAPMLLIDFPLRSPQQFYKAAKQNRPFSSHTWEDGKKHPISQDFADMLGWKELAAKTDSLYASLPDKANTIIITNNYGQAGAINYYSRFKNINAVSFDADYLNWFNLQQPIHNIIRVIAYNDDVIPEKQKAAFTSVTENGKINNIYAREFGTTIYLMKGAKMNINSVLTAKIKKASK